MSRAVTARAPVASLALLAACALLAGCETLRQAPVVDFPEAAPVRIAAPPPPPAVATGGIYQAARYRPLFEEPRARLVGDSLTVQIFENINASQKSSSNIDRASKSEAGISALPLLPAAALARAKLGAGSEQSFSGKGGTESANTFTGAIAVQVVQVLPNGHLVVAGEKQIGVNDNVDVLRFSGTVDPRLIQPGNLVNSQQVANARILSRARGAQGEAQAIGWLSRVFLNVLPF